MPEYLVTIYDRVVRRLEKRFEADTEEDAIILAEEEEWDPANGWEERYDDAASEQYIESVDEEPV